MNLQGRNLTIEMHGDDVQLLQQELALLGFPIPEDELGEAVFGRGTYDAVARFQEVAGLDANGVVDARTARAINAHVDERERPPESRFVVRGRVATPWGEPLLEIAVHAFDRDLRTAQSLGDARTNEDGDYEIWYSREQFARREKDAADLLIRVEVPGRDRLIESAILYNAPAAATIDVIVDRRAPSEFEVVDNVIRPLIANIGVAELTEDDQFDDLSFLAGETGIDAVRLAYFVVAHRYQHRTGLPARAFYGWFRQGMPTELAVLAKQPELELAAALRLAVRANIIPTEFGEDPTALVDRLAAADLAATVEPRDEDPKGSFGTVLSVGLQERDLREDFLRSYVSHAGSNQQFWTSLKERPEFGPERVARLQLTLQLGALTQHHAPLVSILLDAMAEDETRSLRDLASFDHERWTQLVRRAGGPPAGIPGDDEETRRSRYTTTLTRIVEDAFPSATIAHRGQTDPIFAQSGIPRFLATHPDFDIRTTNVDTFLTRVGAPEDHAFRNELKSMQRVYRIAPAYEPMRTLLADQIHSAYAATRMGRNAFIQRYGPEMGATQAKLAYENAAQTTALSTNYVAEFAPGLNEFTFAALPDMSEPDPVDGAPDWGELFGSLDFCACEHCRSVYSPAAYLVDLLHFLKDRKSMVIDAKGNAAIGTRASYDRTNRQLLFRGTMTAAQRTGLLALSTDAQYQAAVNALFVAAPNTPVALSRLPTDVALFSVKDRLFARRPDLGEIELTCDNTNLVLPYVDLVNEVLENAIAPFVPFPVPAALSVDLTAGVVSPALRTVLSTAQRDLGEQAEIVAGEGSNAGRLWALTDHTRRYPIQRDGGGAISVTALAYQTSGTPTELAANPQHVNPAAYVELGRAVYPWTLPFDLWLDEARTYLDHLGVSRTRLMETFRLAGLAPADLIAAAEELQLTANERRLYNGSALVPSRTAPEFYGLPAGAPATWISTAGLLRRLMQTTGLHADEITELLRMRFINPTGTITIEAINAPDVDPNTCDTSKLELRNHDAAALDRIHRFVRLRRRLGWTMRELDRVLAVLNPNQIDGAVIQQLASLNRLATSLSLRVIDLLVFYAPLDTYLYPAPTPDDRPLYDELFLNPAVVKLNPGESGPFALTATANRAEVAVVGNLTDQPVIAALLGALNVAEEELVALISGPHAVVTAGRQLNRDNLSRLTRSVFLARGLGIAAADLPRLIALRGVAPFAASDADLFAGGPPSPAVLNKTRDVVEIAAKLATYSISVKDLDAILAGTSDPSALPAEETLVATLDELRTGLRAIFETTSELSDETGDLIRRQLALLKWDSPLIDLVVNTILGAASYLAPLDPLPANLVFDDIGTRASYDDLTSQLRFRGKMSNGQRTMLLALSNDAPYQAAINTLHAATQGAVSDDQIIPTALAALPAAVTFESLENRVAYDADAKQLRFAGPMTINQRAMLRALSNAALYLGAIDALFAQPRTVIAGKLRAFTLPTFAAPLVALPSNLVFPKALKGKVFFDVGTHELKFTGYMTDTERAALRDLTTDVAFLTAVDQVFNAQTVFAPAASDLFLVAADAALLFDAPQTAPARVKFVLEKLQPYLRRTLSEALAKQKVGEAIGLEPAAGEVLLGRWLRSPTHPALLALSEFLAPAFASSNPSVKVTRTAFPDQFLALVLAVNVATLLTRLRITAPQFAWVFADAAAVGWLDLNQLPVTPVAVPSPLVTPLVRLLDLCRLRDGLRRGERVLARVFDLARRGAPLADVLTALSEETTWSLDDLTYLVDPARFNLAPADFREERGLLRLLDAFTVLHRLGVAAERAIDWAKPEPGEAEARGIKQAVKAKYEIDDWLAMAGPLRDTMRERQRAALVAYLVPRADIERDQRWDDANGLYQHFLIDVEMSPCGQTSRIRQALSSIQLFVQRCLLNLERGIAARADDDDHWREWEWLKSYRVWEANRKVFLYPENWLEPELRIDKSPFFKELEEDLLQRDLTPDVAEDAFLTYLEKLDLVSRLEIQGMFHLVERDDAGSAAVDELHVFGRTRNTPHTYFHRTRVDQLFWGAWEQLDLDIEGDHLIPIVWNRRLHLIWPIFTIESDQQDFSVPGENETVPTPDTFYSIQLAWSEFKNGTWQPKQISREFLETARNSRYESPASYVFKARVEASTGDLLVYCLDWRQPSGAVGLFRFGGCHGIIRTFGLLNDEGNYVVYSPDRSQPVTSAFVEVAELIGKQLYLTTGHAKSGASFEQISKSTSQVKLVEKTPDFGPFRIVYPHQYEQYTAQDVCFIEDGTRTFFVEPRDSLASIDWSKPDDLAVAIDPRIHERYVEKIPWWSDPLGPVEHIQIDAPVYDALTQVSHDVVLTERELSIPANPAGLPVKFQGLSLLPSPMESTSMTRTSRTAGAIRNAKGATPLSILAPRFDGGSRSASIVAVAADSEVFSSRALLSAAAEIDPIQVLAASELTETYDYLWTWQKETRFLLSPFYHPYTCLFTKQLNRNGLDGLLQRSIQVEPQTMVDPVTVKGGLPLAYDFATRYLPNTAVVDTPYPEEEVDFNEQGGYAIYNWELFFHAPLMIANRLTRDQRFEDALRWFHTIFDPTDTSGHPIPKRYWRTRPFHERADASYNQERIETLFTLLAEGKADAKLQAQIKQWRKHPFQPHLIARLRTTAYQKNVVMKYLDNLIAWADYRFRQFGIEALNEATQLYVFAADICGRRPESMAPRRRTVIQTYNGLEPLLDDFSNALVAAEHLVPINSTSTGINATSLPPVTLPALFYFCIPPNDKLLGYWDKIEEQLTKIRNCQDITGQFRRPDLFDPPIDPGALVRAVAGGLDLGTILNDLNAPLPPYRFATMVGKASELCSEVKALGAALLAALEKRDAEALALLRSSHEIDVLKAVRDVKIKQVDEAKRGVESLQKQRELAEIRQKYYTSREEINDGEQKQLDMAQTALILQDIAAAIDVTASALALIPEFKLGSPFSIGVTFGGSNINQGLKGFAGSLGLVAGAVNAGGGMALTSAGYKRRAEEWKLQADLAAKELEQLDKQIAGAVNRVEIADKEVKNHDLQAENAKAVDDFMHDKYTNRELYDWMIGQLSGVYFQAYQLAYDVAKRAEQNYRYELARGDSAFIQFGYWDSLKKGLLAGERLAHDLKRMDLSYHEENRREHELTKRISLAVLDPIALLKLKKTGECFISIPEAIYDLDCAGHYLRRIKHVSVSVPCVAGPYTSVNLTLTLLKSSVRAESRLLAGKYARQDNDPRFRDYGGGVEAIVTSTGQEDAGLFEPNLRDERYLPFEGTGAVSDWHLRLPDQFRQFDYETIADVILHVRYTAREGGGPLRTQTLAEMQKAVNELAHPDAPRGLFRLFSVRQEFSDAWHRFLHPVAGADQVLTLPVAKDRFPYLFQQKRIRVDKAQLIVQIKTGGRTGAPGTYLDAYASGTPLRVTLTPPAGAAPQVDLNSVPTLFKGMPNATVNVNIPVDTVADWTVTATAVDVAAVAAALQTADGTLDPNIVQDLLLALHFRLE